MMKRPSNNSGFTLIETLVAIAIVAAFALMAVDYMSVMGHGGNLTRSVSTRYRVLAGVRNLASLPATLRTSMCAANNGAAVNPALLACAGGNPPNSCLNGVDADLTMFSPLLQRDASGNILGAVVVSFPPLSATNTQAKRFDSFGAPCSTAGPDCPFIVSTKMRAQCGPPPAPAVPPSPINGELTPAPTCSVADVIEVTYTVSLDTTIPGLDPSLSSFIGAATGTVAVPVKLISGNTPQ